MLIHGIVAHPQPTAPAGYTAEAVVFDGTNDYYIGTSPPGILGTEPTAGKQVTMSFWIWPVELTWDYHFFIGKASANTSKGGVIVRFTDIHKLQVLFYDSGGNEIFNWVGDTTITASTWHHIAFSIDMANKPDSYFYVDDVQQTITDTTFTNTNITFDKRLEIGFWNASADAGEYAEYYLNLEEHIDLSITINRRKFLSPKVGSPSTFVPVDLGADGSIPTGTSPLFFFKGPASEWNSTTNNKGSGEDLDMNGSVTDSSNEPVEI